MRIGLPGPGTAAARRRFTRRLGAAGVAAAGASVAVATLGAAPGYATAGHAAPDHYVVSNLVSDIPGLAQETDKNLVNPWGTSEAPASQLWISDQGTGVTSRKGGEPGGLPLTGDATNTIPGGNPTGQVFNPSALSSPGNFVISDKQNHHGPAVVMFASLGGQITGWNVGVGGNGSASFTAEPATSVRGASFTGLAIAGATLYAADFARGRVDVFNASFHLVSRPGAFTDRRIPRGFRPFNVQNIGGNIYVTYAGTGSYAGRTKRALGAGFVDVFSPAGVLKQRLISRGQLDAPWGLVIAPSQFGAFGGDLLVGNFGNGLINAYDPGTGRFLGALLDGNGQPIHEERLWSLVLANGVAGATGTVLFTAGIGNGHHGLIGAIAAPRFQPLAH